eukprot:253206-Hanusia_phi.AAC.1
MVPLRWSPQDGCLSDGVQVPCPGAQDGRPAASARSEGREGGDDTGVDDEAGRTAHAGKQAAGARSMLNDGGRSTGSSSRSIP